MRSLILIAGAALAAGVTTAPVTRPADSGEQIRKGHYLVEHVAMCVQCHTPRDERGELDRTRLLAGAPMPVQSPFPNQQWCFYTPHVAGLPGWDKQDAVRFLQTGETPMGRPAPCRPCRPSADA